MDVKTTAEFLGTSEKAIRGMVTRHLIPFRRLGGRIVFLRTDLERWLQGLEGCTIEEARNNVRIRQGVEV